MADTKDTKKDTKIEEKKAKVSKSNKGRMEQVKRFFVETRAEMRKIVWPTPKQVVNNTVVVLVAILVVGVFIWALDALSSYGLSLIFQNY